MRALRIVTPGLLAVISLSITHDTPAQVLFKKKKKDNPGQRERKTTTQGEQEKYESYNLVSNIMSHVRHRLSLPKSLLSYYEL